MAFLQTVQVLGLLQVAAFHLCPNALPVVFLQTVQVLGLLQVAAFHLCPVVFLQTLQTFAAEQVLLVFLFRQGKHFPLRCNDGLLT